MKSQLTRVLLIFLAISIIIIAGCKSKKITFKGQKVLEGKPKIVYQSNYKLETGKRGGSFIRADIQDLDNLNIVTTRSRSVYNVLKLVFEGLLSINPYNGRITGCLARDYRVSDNGLSITLHLNNNVFFSDGKKCTSDDVIFSFDKIYLNPAVNSKKIDTLTIRNQIINIKKIDNYTVRFDLPVPYRPFLYTLTQLEILPKHILAPEIEKNGIEWLNKEWGSKNGGVNNLIGTGPYKISEYQKGKLISFKRNPYYSKRKGTIYLDGMPYLDEIIELLNIDNDTKLLKFEIGEIDFYNCNNTDFKNGNMDSLIKNRKEGNYNLYYNGQTTNSNNFLVFNQNPKAVNREKSKLFRDKQFREAVSLCINRKKISKDLYMTYSSDNMSPLRDSSPYFKNEEVKNYNPTRAKEILQKMGLKDSNKDGFFNLPSGKDLKFTILTNIDNPLRRRMGEEIVNNLKEIGIKADISAIDYNLLVTKLLDNFQWEAVIIGASGSIEPNDLAWIWESHGPLHLWYPYQDKPSTQWEKRIDELFAMGRTTWNFEKAKTFYDEFQDIATEFLPLINVVTPFQIYGVRKGYKNIFSLPATYNDIGIMPYIFHYKN